MEKCEKKVTFFVDFARFARKRKVYICNGVYRSHKFSEIPVYPENRNVQFIAWGGF